jgi:uncharacterized protein YndB with AHSA1/START domain
MVASGRIEREIVVEAPIDVVWEVVTAREHISQWLSDEAQVELRPGGRGLLTWTGSGAWPLRVVTVEAPRRFAFRWVRREGVEVEEGNSTLVEMLLTEEGEGTRLRVVETGFANLPWPEAERAVYEEENRAGWERELGELSAYLARLDFGSRQ